MPRPCQISNVFIRLHDEPQEEESFLEHRQAKMIQFDTTLSPRPPLVLLLDYINLSLRRSTYVMRQKP